jgi:hypothetical protein
MAGAKLREEGQGMNAYEFRIGECGWRSDTTSHETKYGGGQGGLLNVHQKQEDLYVFSRFVDLKACRLFLPSLQDLPHF